MTPARPQKREPSRQTLSRRLAPCGLALIAALWLCVPAGCHASAAPFAMGAQPPSQPTLALHPTLGAQLPLALRFTSTEGRAVTLGDYFNGSQPVVLVMGYGRCQELCGTIMQAVLHSLVLAGLQKGSYRLLDVSIDPQERPADAGARQQNLLRSAGVGQDDLSVDTVVGTTQSIDSLADAVGFDMARDASQPAIAHAVGFVVLTPEGRVSSYFTGLGADPARLRQALQDASGGGLGRVSEQILLRCVHFDPTLGRHSITVMAGLRATGIVLVACLATWLWRHRRPSREAQT